jgi:mannosyl-oligosaccharide alpha-1,2-mannosidase
VESLQTQTFTPRSPLRPLSPLHPPHLPSQQDSKGKPRRAGRRTGVVLPLLLAAAFYGLYSHAAKPASAAAASSGARASLVASRALAAGGPRVAVAPAGAAADAAAVPATAAAPPHAVPAAVPDPVEPATKVAVPEAHPEPAGAAADATAAETAGSDAASVDPAALATQVESARARLEAAVAAKPGAAAGAAAAADGTAAASSSDPVWPPLPPESAALITSTLRDQVALAPPPGAPPAERRRLAVRAAMAHAWAGYVRYAWGEDELAPITKRGYETFCSLGATLVDAMDTLKLMGFHAEFERAKDWVVAGEAGGLAFDRDCSVSAFEATIRVVGGLLAAADLAPEAKASLVPRAEALAGRLLKAYDTPLGFPRSSINLKTGAATTPAWIGQGKAALLAELGTVQLELLKLAEATGKKSYADAAERIVAELHARHPGEGLIPIYVRLDDAGAVGPLTMGGMSDSYYEYLLKAWLLKGKDEARAGLYRDMWVRAMDETLDKLVATHPVDGRMYVGERGGLGPDAKLVPKMEHLACFLPANLALGVLEGAVDGDRAARYTEAAKGLAETCYRMYSTNPTGLAAEHVTFGPDAPMAAGRTARFNLLRPEAVEALVMLHRLTGEAKYQDWGWAMFTAFERVSRVATGGHSGVQDVTAGGPALPGLEARAAPVLNDRQESFWLAESLKYFYLLFAPADTLPLSGPGAWVLNTEAHPLKPLGAGAVEGLTNEMSAAGVAAVLARLSGKPPAAATGAGADAVASQESAPAHPGSVLTRPQGGGGGVAGVGGGAAAGGNPVEGSAAASHLVRPGHEGALK